MAEEIKIEQKIDNVTDIDKLEELENEVNEEENEPPKTEEDNKDGVENKDSDSETEDKDDDTKNKDTEQEDDEEDKQPEDNKKLKTLISDEDRKKFNIPEKFKYMEDVISWGREAEKAKNQYDLQKNKTIAENNALREELEKLKKDVEQVRNKQQEPTKEQKQQMIDKFNEEFMEDPISAIKNVMQQMKVGPENKVESEQDKIDKTKEMFNKKAKSEWEDLTKNMTDEEKIEYGKECQKVANEHPEIISLYVIDEMIAGRKARQEKILAKEQERKNKEKRAAAATVSNNTVVRNETFTKIDKAKSLADLDKLEEEINNGR